MKESTQEIVRRTCGRGNGLEYRYERLIDSVYGALAVQTRLKPYLDSISVDFAADGSLQYDLTTFDALLADKRATDDPGNMNLVLGIANNDTDALNHLSNVILFKNLSDLIGVETVSVGENGIRRARGGVLLGQERSEAANDAGYTNSFGRKAA